jgi:GMP synthase (glutamine-hydrolysing)
MKTCLALRHVAFEDLGTLAGILATRGYATRYLEVGVDRLQGADIQGADLLVVLGAPIGVYEEEAYPFLINETKLIAERLHAGLPTLGICLGAQLMAKALGATVAPGPVKEIGIGPVELTAEARATPLRHLENTPVLNWHGDNLDLPEGSERLAFTRHCPVQAFRKGPNLLGLQFHIEIDAHRAETWLIGHTVELAKSNIDPRAIRHEIARHGRMLHQVAHQVFNEWLDGLCVPDAVQREAVHR